MNLYQLKWISRIFFLIEITLTASQHKHIIQFYVISFDCFIELYQTDEDNPEELTIRNVTHEHEGWYTCIAANSLGTSNANAYLHVIDGKFFSFSFLF